jgi:hypothetical protein
MSRRYCTGQCLTNEGAASGDWLSHMYPWQQRRRARSLFACCFSRACILLVTGHASQAYGAVIRKQDVSLASKPSAAHSLGVHKCRLTCYARCYNHSSLSGLGDLGPIHSYPVARLRFDPRPAQNVLNEVPHGCDVRNQSNITNGRASVQNAPQQTTCFCSVLPT